MNHIIDVSNKDLIENVNKRWLNDAEAQAKDMKIARAIGLFLTVSMLVGICVVMSGCTTTISIRPIWSHVVDEDPEPIGYGMTQDIEDLEEEPR